MTAKEEYDGRTDRRRWKRWFAWRGLPVKNAGSHASLIVSSIVLITPVLMAILLTTQTTLQIYNADHTGLGSLGTMVQNYYDVLVEWNFWRLMLNTLFVAGVVTVGTILFSLFAALAIVYYEFRFSRLVFFFILLTLMVPFVIRVVPLYELVVLLGWHDTYAGLMVPFFASATAVFLLRQHFRSIPTELVETCQLDGIGPLRFLWRVLVPMTKGMISGLSVILFIGTWNAYLWPLIVINTENKQMVQVGLRMLQSAERGALTEYNLIMAGAVLSLLPALALLIALRKNLLTTMGLEVN